VDGAQADTDPGACPQFYFTSEQRRVSVFYVYIWDSAMGAGSSRSAATFRCATRRHVTEWR
jgi:hypothetical protein